MDEPDLPDEPLPPPCPPLDIVSFGAPLVGADGKRYVRASARVFWRDAPSATGIVIEVRLPVEVKDGATFDAMRAQAFAALPALLRAAATRSEAPPRA